VATNLLRRLTRRTTAFPSIILAMGLCLGVLAPAPPAMAAAPTISSFSPASGTISTTVTITGSGFTGATKVTFNAVAAPFTVTSDTQITSTVPSSASTGPITVTAPGGTVASAKKFTVTPGIVLSPGIGPRTSKVAVTGAGFGSFEAVDVFVDTTDVALAGTNGTGNFGPIAVTVSAAAVPGTHWISAQGRRSGLFAQSTFTVQTDWPAFRYSGKHKGFNPYENVLNTGTVSAIDQDWSFATGNGVFSSPAVANGVVYFGSKNGTVYALSAATGAKLWSFTTGAAVFSSPVVANGVVYIGSEDHNLYALSAATGAKLWSFTTGNFIDSSPAVANGVVYVGSFDGSVYALSAATGAKLWSSTTGNTVQSSPAVAGGVVYIGSDDGSVYALSAATGAKLWSFITENGVLSSPAVANGVVYVGSFDGSVYALSAATGVKLWSFTTGGPVFSSAAVAYGVVYVGSDDGKVYALSAATGAGLWSFTTGSFVESSPAVAGGVVYMGSDDHNVYALSAATGTDLWSFTTGSSFVDSSPAVANGVVYTGSFDGNLYAFDLAGGAGAVHRPAVGQLRPDYRLKRRR
jgi:outer membrane protein assembly factor BamB